MPGPVGDPEEGVVRAAVFATTRWTLILTAQESSEAGLEALDALCRRYWFPVYAMVRKRGFDPEAARDFTQDFFARLLSRDGLATARQERGRFRGFLARSVKNFLADAWDRSQAAKRGGGRVVLSLDAEEAEGRYLEAAEEVTPDRLFDRQWAFQLLAGAGARLREEYGAAGRISILEVLERCGDPESASLAEEAGRLEMPVNTLKSHLRRARIRHAELLREMVAETVDSPDQVEVELGHLMEALRG